MDGWLFQLGLALLAGVILAIIGEAIATVYNVYQLRKGVDELIRLERDERDNLTQILERTSSGRWRR